MTDFPETADIETANADYASRFAGPAGAWLLDVQTDRLKASLQDLPPGGTALDVGGGHAQTAPVLVAHGFSTTVTGSAPSCRERLPGTIPFQLANHLDLPYENRSIDVVISFRLMPHCERWPELVKELCRVADKRVIVDYPAKQSVNFLADTLFGLKKNVEKNTRTFTLFSHHEVREAFEAEGFKLKRHPQFFWPMVLHRMLKRPGLSRALESVPRVLGLTALFGSPVVLEARRN
ncbi:MAG: class I SAM-dependent methyltransferase [Verrucomicrobia bacterium]|nr:class I SAM-dependent methyltransferase [Verrucomicrobiota bacterium]MCH8525805.1 class I SAM-dependent methyltransferase [Kiritimatiellia bacterium]